MRGLIKASNMLERLVVWVGQTSAWVILALIAVIIFDVITRKIYWTQQLILNSWAHEYASSTKLQEWEWHLHTVVFLLALGYAYSKNAHVRVDLVREKLTIKKQVWIELLGCLLFLIPYTALVFYFAVFFVQQAWVSNEASAAMTGLGQRWIIKSFILAGMALAFLAGVSSLLRQAIWLLAPELRQNIKLNQLTGEAAEIEEARAKLARETAAALAAARRQPRAQGA
jgi:TRAP-type mannitol/chloroaromatic compound transport system permease small subunit